MVHYSPEDCTHGLRIIVERLRQDLAESTEKLRVAAKEASSAQKMQKQIKKLTEDNNAYARSCAQLKKENISLKSRITEINLQEKKYKVQIKRMEDEIAILKKNNRYGDSVVRRTATPARGMSVGSRNSPAADFSRRYPSPCASRFSNQSHTGTAMVRRDSRNVASHPPLPPGGRISPVVGRERQVSAARSVRSQLPLYPSPSPSSRMPSPFAGNAIKKTDNQRKKPQEIDSVRAFAPSYQRPASPHQPYSSAVAFRPSPVSPVVLPAIPPPLRATSLERRAPRNEMNLNKNESFLYEKNRSQSPDFGNFATTANEENSLDFANDEEFDESIKIDPISEMKKTDNVKNLSLPEIENRLSALHNFLRQVKKNVSHNSEEM